jgi:streptomycin 6-kinase
MQGEREPWLVPLLWNRFSELNERTGLRDRIAALVDIGELDAERAHGWTGCAHIARGLTGT